MNLLLLAPEIQEAVLNLPEVEYVRDEVGELRVRAIASVPDWGKQRRMWAELLERSGRAGSRRSAEVAAEKRQVESRHHIKGEKNTGHCNP